MRGAAVRARSPGLILEPRYVIRKALLNRDLPFEGKVAQSCVVSQQTRRIACSNGTRKFHRDVSTPAGCDQRCNPCHGRSLPGSGVDHVEGLWLWPAGHLGKQPRDLTDVCPVANLGARPSQYQLSLARVQAGADVPQQLLAQVWPV